MNSKVIQLLAAKDMVASFISDVIDLRQWNLSALFWRINLAGTHVGEIAIQLGWDKDSVDPLDWAPMVLEDNSALKYDAADGVAQERVTEITPRKPSAAPFMRVVWTRTSGTGAMDAWVLMKRLQD